ncbi:neurotrypsin-like isoform X1 [Hyla sarda]|uniref:neurotrypsin-like isoform X1 n=2 Tax=Hyla sarda TaxID=327740 RepID=UPI0024C445A7|nr:neurotrypsin-like isoform X1 [Hyla sarda]
MKTRSAGEETPKIEVRNSDRTCQRGKDIVNSLLTQKHLLPTGYNPCSDGVDSLGYYNGSISITESGSDCLNWAEFPDYMKQYPGRGLGYHNHCRNPDGGNTPWCFYRQQSGMISWAHCDCSQGAVRLLGDHFADSGGVQLYLKGVWGTICGDYWTDWDASVVCRQLGISEIGTAKRIPYYAPWTTPVNLESANCRGDEKALLHCSYTKGKACSSRQIAAITCSPPEGLKPPLRLVGGNDQFEGRVEVFFEGQWGTICDDHWDDKDAEVICRQLGFNGKPKAWVWAHYGQGSGPILLDEVECIGNESSLDFCQKSDWRHHNCDHIEDAGVSCNPFKDGAVRLSGGQIAGEGRVEVYYNGDWGTVCDDDWTELNAQVVCRQLGFSGPSSLASKGEFGPGDGMIFLDDVACTGTERSLVECSRSSWGQHDCSHFEDVGLRCSNDSNDIIETPPGPPVRLMDGEGTKEGRVEVFLNGEWGSVCDDGWNDKDAVVVCRQLGHRGPAKARTMAYFGEGQGPIHLDNVECNGTENTLAECKKQDSGIHNCWHSEDAGVICDYVEKKMSGLTDGVPAKCGISHVSRRKKRIVGGTKSMRGGWPWQASLRLKGFSKESRLLCGATLISNCWALTAAHCFKRFGDKAHKYSLRVGDYHTGVEDDFERELPVQKIVIHKKYHSGSNDNDIALVRLQGKDDHCISFSYHVLPICIPERKESSVYKKPCFISGWGDTGTSYSKTLLEGAVPILPKEKCIFRYKGKFTNRMICAGNLSEDNRVDSCQGDSGGPLMCQNANGQWIIVGITSWGYGCGRKDYPGVYTKVNRFIPWIKRVTKLK